MKPYKQTSIYSLACLLLITCVVLTHPARAENKLPESFTATYTLNKGPLTLAEMTRKLYQNERGNYVFESYSKPLGYARWFTDSTLLEKTEWTYHQQQLRPIEYIYDRKSSKKKRHVILNFDWDKMRVTNDINDDRWSMKITDGTLDKLLYHLAVMYDLANGKELFEYQVADGGQLKTFNFNNLGEETVRTKLGTFNTIKLIRPGKRDTILWCAKELNYLPIKLEQEENGIQLTLILKSVSGLPVKNN